MLKLDKKLGIGTTKKANIMHFLKKRNKSVFLGWFKQIGLDQTTLGTYSDKIWGSQFGLPPLFYIKRDQNGQNRPGAPGGTRVQNKNEINVCIVFNFKFKLLKNYILLRIDNR